MVTLTVRAEGYGRDGKRWPLSLLEFERVHD